MNHPGLKDLQNSMGSKSASYPSRWTICTWFSRISGWPMTPMGGVRWCPMFAWGMHQIRAHMASIGCPLVGDRVWASKMGSVHGVFSQQNVVVDQKKNPFVWRKSPISRWFPPRNLHLWSFTGDLCHVWWPEGTLPESDMWIMGFQRLYLILGDCRLLSYTGLSCWIWGCTTWWSPTI